MDVVAGSSLRPAALVVIDPSGHRSEVRLDALPFRIGRHADNHLILRDNRVSRNHAQIVGENGEYVLEDSRSRHGTYVNGERIERRRLRDADRIDFGFADSYQLIFSQPRPDLGSAMARISVNEQVATAPAVGGNLPKLRAILEVARALETSFSMQDVLVTVVDAALTITGAERGFLLLKNNGELEVRVARNNQGASLGEGELRVSRKVIQRALQQRRELLYMNFDPLGEEGILPEHSIADLALRSVVCIPLVRVAAGGRPDATTVGEPAGETVGVLYMDSRLSAADLTGGNRELLQSLAIEASTVLENARLLEEERRTQKIQEELRLARAIQQSLLPRTFPAKGWFRASGSSVASHQVGGDYFDFFAVSESCWSAVVADVCGKGVSSALLASLLQGAFLTVSASGAALEEGLWRINRFLVERTGGEKYATVFIGMLEQCGRLRYANAGHCAPAIVRTSGVIEDLSANAVPIGLIEPAEFPVAEVMLGRGDKIVIYSDGVTEAQSPDGEFFGRKRLRDLLAAHAQATCTEVQAVIQEAIDTFTRGAPQSDDMTLVVIEYNG